MMQEDNRKELIERLRSESSDASNRELLLEAADLVERCYCDGFDAACDVAASVNLRVSCEIDPAIQLGIGTVSRILAEQCRNLRNKTSNESE